MFFQQQKKKFSKIFQNILCRMEKYNLFLSTNIILFHVLTSWIHHFVLFFGILCQDKKFYVKRKNNTQSSCMIIFRILSKWYHNECKQHVNYYWAIQSSIYTNIFSVEKKLQKWIYLSIRHVSIRHNCFFKD